MDEGDKSEERSYFFPLFFSFFASAEVKIGEICIEFDSNQGLLEVQETVQADELILQREKS